MSCTLIYGFGMDGTCTDEVVAIQNAFRGGIAVWRALEKKYLPSYRPAWVPKGVSDDEILDYIGFEPSRATSLTDDEAIKDIWNLFKAENTSETDRIVLGTTFDNVLVRRGNILKVVEAFEAFDKEHEGMSNLKEQADGIRSFLADPQITAIGWNQTSVNGDDWSNSGETMEDEDGDEVGGPYNFKTGTDHWWLFDEIEKVVAANGKKE